jgi:hypothetical protein
MVVFQNNFYTLTPSFKVRILIPLPRGKEHLIEMLFFSSLEEMRIRRILITNVVSNKVLGYPFKIFDFVNGSGSYTSATRLKAFAFSLIFCSNPPISA